MRTFNLYPNGDQAAMILRGSPKYWSRKHGPYHVKMTVEQRRQIFNLYYEQNKTVDEIAAMFGVSNKTVSNFMDQARMLRRPARARGKQQKELRLHG